LAVFPRGDSGVRRGLGLVRGLPRPVTPEEEALLVERFGPYRGMLYFLTVAARLWQLGLLTPFVTAV
jgi:3-methyladenine DNA glycosylase/8-oxoguanine DNA glycosylase